MSDPEDWFEVHGCKLGIGACCGAATGAGLGFVIGVFHLGILLLLPFAFGLTLLGGVAGFAIASAVAFQTR